MKDRTFKVLAAPGVLASSWAIFISVAGVSGYSIAQVAALFWAGTGLAVAAFFGIIATRKSASSFYSYFVPFVASSAVMFPWLRRGLSLFPGSWVWDGWAYIAFGQGFLKYPLDTEMPKVISPMYELGIGFLFHTRFVSAGLLAAFASFPFANGDTQSAFGFVLFFYVFMLACSIGALATVLFPERRMLRWAYIVLATVSGYVTTTLHANNLDQLLAMGLLPLTVALALKLEWANRNQATLLGFVCAGMTSVYPELSPATLGMPAVVIMWRIWNEGRGAPGMLKSVALGLFVFFLAASPAIYGLASFFVHQLALGAQAFAAGQMRPGEDYFVQFYFPECTLGAIWSLYPPMMMPRCHDQFAFQAGNVGVALTAISLVGAVLWPRRLKPILFCAILPLLVGILILVVNHYDYAAYKFFGVGFPFWSALAVYGAFCARSLFAKLLMGAVAVSYFAVVALRISYIDDAAKYKTVEVFKAPLSDIRSNANVALKLSDSLAYEWAAYYLRDNNLITIEGALVYLPNPKSARPEGKAQYLVTDTTAPSCWGQAIGSSDAYAVFRSPGTEGDCAP